jgi:hypothetical protein
VEHRSTLRLLTAISGMIAWGAQFTVIYGVTSLVCARGYSDASWFGMSAVRLTIGAATLIAAAATGFVLARALQERRRMDAAADPTDRFLNYTTRVVSGLSLVVIAWHGLPALIVPVCT